MESNCHCLSLHELKSWNELKVIGPNTRKKMINESSFFVKYIFALEKNVRTLSGFRKIFTGQCSTTSENKNRIGPLLTKSLSKLNFSIFTIYVEKKKKQ